MAKLVFGVQDGQFDLGPARVTAVIFRQHERWVAGDHGGWNVWKSIHEKRVPLNVTPRAQLRHRPGDTL